MKKNLTLIGMPGAGKSTIGILLAKDLSLNFLDTDVLIQVREGRSLQKIMEAGGHLYLRQIEEEVICGLEPQKHVIATGGSVVYSEPAMRHLHELSTVIFLRVSYLEILRRIHNFATRGIAKAPGQSFEELFAERQALYERHGDITIACDGRSQENIVEDIAAAVCPTNKFLCLKSSALGRVSS